jgi:transposase
MNFIKGAARDEVLLLPESLDDFVHGDNPVRLIDQFVDGLDLRALGFSYPKQDHMQRGRPTYDPADLLKLLMYGYSNGIRSGRKLQKACHVNVELMWLLKKLAPDFKTICDFRRQNRNSFKSVSAEFTLMCQRMNLISAEFIAVDGSLLKASNNKEKSWNEAKIDSAITRNENAVEHYLKQIEDVDDDASEQKRELEQKLAKVRDQKKDSTP